MLVRRLIPQALPGTTMADAVSARLDYARLDASAATRIRLNSTVVRVRHAGEREVEITYVRGNRARSVRASACVLACWNTSPRNP